MELKGTFELSPSLSLSFFLRAAEARRPRAPPIDGSLPPPRLPLSSFLQQVGVVNRGSRQSVRMRNVLRRTAKREAEFMTFATCDSAGGLGYTAGTSKPAWSS